MSNNKCVKKDFNGCCCCNCKNHLEDFYHCTTMPKSKGVEGCVCSVHKGWICKTVFADSNEIFYYSGWSEHGICELHKKND